MIILGMRAHVHSNLKTAASADVMETNSSSQQKRHRKFNPPLKSTLLSETTSQDSYYSATSWSLPPTQTHTVLSYCEEVATAQDQLQLDAAIEQEGGSQTERNFSLQRSQRKYNYGVHHTRKITRKPRPKTSAASAGTTVHDVYSLTPSEQVLGPKRHKKRTKEQVRYHASISPYKVHIYSGID